MVGWWEISDRTYSKSPCGNNNKKSCLIYLDLLHYQPIFHLASVHNIHFHPDSDVHGPGPPKQVETHKQINFDRKLYDMGPVVPQWAL